MSEQATIARPYAKAAFEFAVEKGAIDNWREMLFFAAEVSKNADMIQFLNGSSSSEKMSEVFIHVCGEQLNEQGQNLIKVMAENRRLPALPAVVSLYAEMYAEFNKEVAVEVTSAVELQEEQKGKLISALETRLARKVKLNCSVDNSIVSGLLIKAGDTVIDGTTKGKLNRLSVALQS